MAPKIHLYLTPGSCSLAAHIALQETGFAFTTTDLKAARGYPTEHLHINPKGRVPILELDGELITETPAILSTISALVPDRKLLGSTILEQACMARLLRAFLGRRDLLAKRRACMML
jgi:glutathione S-transferase